MLSIFEFSNYRNYLEGWIEAQGARAYGLKGKIAEALGISSSLVSQILKGEKSLTQDQASELCDFIGLNELESDYLHLLVELDRTGNLKYRHKLERKMRVLQQQSRQIGKRVPRHHELTDEQKAIYYSSWIYTGVRNLVAVPGCDTVDKLATQLKMDYRRINQVVQFLLNHGLCREEGGKLNYGPASLHVERESPFVNKHHQNWRVKSLALMEEANANDLYFTSPMSLSKEAYEQILKMIPNFIQSVMEVSGPSPSETVACLNIDWFSYSIADSQI
ncbi:MAG: TIGR02147 family protein [Bdellovibrionales bacterium]|nr:TIGR02147 family protein [Bdellovibrionales bacterium]